MKLKNNKYMKWQLTLPRAPFAITRYIWAGMVRWFEQSSFWFVWLPSKVRNTIQFNSSLRHSQGFIPSPHLKWHGSLYSPNCSCGFFLCNLPWKDMTGGYMRQKGSCKKLQNIKGMSCTWDMVRWIGREAGGHWNLPLKTLHHETSIQSDDQQIYQNIV